MPESALLSVLSLFYLMLPAYLSNMAPVIVKKINFLKAPIDFNKTLKGRPVFGKNKTYRGLFFGVLFGIMVAYVQFILYRNGIFAGIVIADYSQWLLLGFLMGLGAIFGDLAESFFKRRLNYAPGKSFFPFDQTDFIVGALIFSYPLVNLGWGNIVIILVLSCLLHILVNHFAYYTGIRKERW